MTKHNDSTIIIITNHNKFCDSMSIKFNLISYTCSQNIDGNGKRHIRNTTYSLSSGMLIIDSKTFFYKLLTTAY